VKVDIILTRRRRQHNLGRVDAMICYFEQNKKIKKLTRPVIFDNNKERGVA
jgi:hypothetical protein